jgi:thiol-disulfide isomerase/thioredoxin
MRLLYLLLVILAFNFTVSAQSDSAIAGKQKDSGQVKNDTLTAYEKNRNLPTFSLQRADSSWFHRSSLKNKPVLILYFSPDCGYCQIETEDVIAKINGLRNLQIVMVTSRPLEDMANFIAHYKLNRFKTIVVAKDHARFFSRYYDIQTTPFSALYDKEHKLVKVYKKGIDFTELINLVN